MRDILLYKLHEYIRQNNPELLAALEESGNVTNYLEAKVDSIEKLLEELLRENKPDYIIEEVCMDSLTKDLRPSKYNYILDILEEDFSSTVYALQQSGTVRYEVMNIIDHSQLVFESLRFTEENEDSREIRYTVTGIISEYLAR